MQWLDIKYLKMFYPLQLAEYTVANKINEKPAFNWWFKDTFCTRYRISSRMKRHGVYEDATGQGEAKKKYWRTTHKFGIMQLKIVEDTLDIDRKMGTDFQDKSIMKEMKNVIVEFNKIDGVKPEQMVTGKIKPGYSISQLIQFLILK